MGRNPYSDDSTKPAVGGFSITAGATALTRPTRWLYVGTSGNVTVTLLNGESVEYLSLAAGVFHPIACTHVTAATATGIVGGD